MKKDPNRKEHWIKIKPSKYHAVARAQERNVTIPKKFNILNGRARWRNAKIDAYGSVCIEMWIPSMEDPNTWYGIPLAFQSKTRAVSKTSLDRPSSNVITQTTDNIYDFPLVVEYLGL